MSNHTQREELKTKVDSHVVYANVAARDDELPEVTDYIMGLVDQYTQRLVLEGKLEELYELGGVPDDYHGIFYKLAERVLELQSQLDKLNGDSK